MIAMPLCAPSSLPAQRVAGVRLRGRVLRATSSDADRSKSSAEFGHNRRELLFAGGVASAAPSVLDCALPRVVCAAAETSGGGPLPLVPKAELAPNLEVSQVIKGCWQLSGGHRGDRSSDRTSGQAAVDDFKNFVDAGITTFDTADIYGPSEELIGRFLQAQRTGAPPVQVLTKLCCFGGDQNKAKQLDFVKSKIEQRLTRLGVPQLELVQFYWNDYDVRNYVAASKHLAQLQADGLIKHVGVTNFDVVRMQQMMDAGVVLASNQVQYSLLDRRPQVKMTEFCQANNIQLLPFGVLGGSFLTDRYLGVAVKQVAVDTYSKSKYASVIQEVGSWSWIQQLLTQLRGIADKHDTSIANVASKWVLAQPCVPAIIVGARNSNHVQDHRQLFTFSLDADDLRSIDAILQQSKQPTGDIYDWERGGKW